METLSLQPIGVFTCAARYPYDVPRQGAVARNNQGIIRLRPDLAGALDDLTGFSHIWVLYWFHLNHGWHGKVQPPRHVDHKVGVFASRSPYRPNPIGMSAVKLDYVDGLEVHVSRHDLLDGTPVLDIKPYLAYADSFPDAALGWTAEGEDRHCQVFFDTLAEEKCAWLEENGVSCLRQFTVAQLEYAPLNPARHRLLEIAGRHALAYRTWRILFSVDGRLVQVMDIVSGYTSEELASTEDKYSDKGLHRTFVASWGHR